MSYDSRHVVGDFFEELVSEMFGLERIDPDLQGQKPDLYSERFDFYVEVKSSFYRTGGVIKERQLNRYNTKERRFHAFPYHSIAKIQETCPTEQDLRDVLDLKSFYLFPYSVARACFDVFTKRGDGVTHEKFVTLSESKARRIFRGEEKIWEELGLDLDEYETTSPHRKVNIMTRRGHLERKLLQSFNPDCIN